MASLSTNLYRGIDFIDGLTIIHTVIGLVCQA